MIKMPFASWSISALLLHIPLKEKHRRSYHMNEHVRLCNNLPDLIHSLYLLLPKMKLDGNFMINVIAFSIDAR